MNQPKLNRKQQMTDLNQTCEDFSLKLAKISEVMGDAFYFIQIREFVHIWIQQEQEGDPMVEEMMRIIDTFYRLCKTIQDRSKGNSNENL